MNGYGEFIRQLVLVVPLAGEICLPDVNSALAVPAQHPLVVALLDEPLAAVLSFYLYGAVAKDEWTTYRLTGDALAELAGE